MENVDGREVQIELPPAMFSLLSTQAHHEKGFSAILIGHIQKTKKVLQTDEKDTREKILLCLRVEAMLELEAGINQFLDADGKVKLNELTQFCCARIPRSSCVNNIQILGLLSNIPEELDFPTKKDKQFVRTLFRIGNKLKILMGVTPIKPIRSRILTNSVKVAVLDEDRQWKENMGVKIKNMNDVPNSEYMQPKSDAICFTGSKISDPTSHEVMKTEMVETQIKIHEAAKKLFELKEKQLIQSLS
eukprot:TRINITY_DN2334_c0_g1_i10.p1 TRINITY_DN2334_c0_g1~~TRINITY_DN2334_c0_g1_i10.p1  ORF type:complete len:261 (-),score=44.50 TRINITY_DN2334_c0_g1_i10:670-1407(-)